MHVHPGAGHSYAPESMFAGREIENRVTVEWGQWSVVRSCALRVHQGPACMCQQLRMWPQLRCENVAQIPGSSGVAGLGSVVNYLCIPQMQAEVNLIEAALRDARNERFVLLSESCIPLYPALLVWAELLAEPRSRINACADAANPDDANRRMTYRCGMANVV